jgi:hypothetical protein
MERIPSFLKPISPSTRKATSLNLRLLFTPSQIPLSELHLLAVREIKYRE